MPAVYDPEQLDEKERSASDPREGHSPDSENLYKNETTPNGSAPHENTVGDGYKPSQPKYELPTSFIDRIKKRPRLVIGLGAGSALIIFALFAFFSFLGNFKMDFLISNIDQRVFLRFTSVADRRSSKWLQSYLTVRMTQWGDGNAPGQIDNNQFFRSNKVDTNSPFTDWYRTLRTSKFEQELFERRGIKFVSIADENGKVKPGYININGEDPIDISISQADFDGIGDGDIAAINRFSKYFDFDTFDSDREARRAIKKVVNDNTRFYQLLERRHYRKAIQNMTGVRSWRFFEDTQNKIDEKKINIRSKLITAAIPESTMAGKFLRCMMGLATCQKSVDPANPQYRATVTAITGADVCDSDCEDQSTLKADNYDPNSDPNNPLRGKVEVDDPKCPKGQTCPKIKVDAPDYDLTPRESQILDFMRSSIRGVYVGLSLANVISLLEMLDGIDNALSGGLTKMVAVARGVQSMGLYQVTKTTAHQQRSGNVNSTELNQFVPIFDTATSSEGWTKVISGKGDPSKITESAESQKYCSKENQEFITNPNNAEEASKQFHYLCPAKQIGGGSNAASIEAAYNSAFGVILGPIADAWRGLKNAGGGILGRIIAFGYKLVEGLLGATANALIAIIKFVGLGDSLKKVEVAMYSLVGKIASFLGAGPILSQNDPAGVFFNWMVQGGAYTAENVARYNGAAATNPQSQAAGQRITENYQTSQFSGMSIFDRYVSTSNPDSLSSKSLFALSQQGSADTAVKLLNIGNLFKSFASSVTKPFHTPATAADYTGYEGASFAGIQTFDYPQQCIDLDPIFAGPTSGTNIFGILSQYGIGVSPGDWGPTTKEQWAVVNDSNKFYDYLYSKVGDRENPDEISLKIYNCNLLDTSIRGSLGYLYGYTKDNGLEESASSTTTGGGGGVLDCSKAGDPSTWIDWSAGTPDKYADRIAQYAEGRTCTDEQLAKSGFKTPSNAVPNDGSRQYFASYAWVDPANPVPCEELQDGNKYPGKRCIAAKYRNPPTGGNTIPIPID